jgi:hypothetical protein
MVMMDKVRIIQVVEWKGFSHLLMMTLIAYQVVDVDDSKYSSIFMKFDDDYML